MAVGKSRTKSRDRDFDCTGKVPLVANKPIASARSADDLRAQILSLVADYAAQAHAAPPFDPDTSLVPVSGRVYGADEMVSLVDAALDFWLTTGRFNEAFEKALADYVGRRYAATVNSGSSANLVAFAALTSHLMGERALNAGDEVITCATGFPTTVNPTLLYGLVPVFVDVDIPTYNIDVSALEEAVTDRTRAIMIAHTLGNPFNLDTVTAFAKKHKLRLIEDCCDALGATYRGRHVGTFGDIGTLSFYPAHHITMGEGGAVFTGDPVLRRAMLSIRDWGRDCYCDPGKDNTCRRRFDWQLGELPYGFDHKYTYSHLGFNLKITDMQAAVGLAQLDRMDTFIAARQRNFDLLYSGLSRFEEYFILPQATPGSQPSWFGFPITLREGAPFSRDALVRWLNGKRIGTRFLFGGNLVRQPYMIDRPHRKIGDLRNADRVMNGTFWLGVYPGLSNAHIEYVVETFERFIADRRKAA